MRFDVSTTTNKPATLGSNRLRLWMLVGSLGIVLAAMHELRQEETIERLDQLFGVADDSRESNQAELAADPGVASARDSDFNSPAPQIGS